MQLFNFFRISQPLLIAYFFKGILESAYTVSESLIDPFFLNWDSFNSQINLERIDTCLTSYHKLKSNLGELHI